jgi:hypothetical protein
MLAGINAMAAANTEVVYDFNYITTGSIICEFNRAGRDATLAIDALAFYCLDDRS